MAITTTSTPTTLAMARKLLFALWPLPLWLLRELAPAVVVLVTAAEAASLDGDGMASLFFFSYK
jgi:hypothetical protein